MDEASSLAEHHTSLVAVQIFSVLKFLADRVNAQLGRGPLKELSSQRRSCQRRQGLAVADKVGSWRNTMT